MITAADGIDGVFAGAVIAQVGGRDRRMQGCRRPRHGRRAQRPGQATPPIPVDQARDVATEGLRMGQQLVRKHHRLHRLQMVKPGTSVSRCWPAWCVRASCRSSNKAPMACACSRR